MLAPNKDAQLDKRTASRFSMSLPLHVDGKTGTTRNVSTRGIYFETDESYTPGAELQLSMDLLNVMPEGAAQLICKGRIVRVEPKEGRLGIAVTIESHHFEPNA